MSSKILVSRLERTEHSGDWHDSPLKWQVVGPGTEVQKFFTKKNALLYAKIRRNSKDFNEACRKYSESN
jgi:hypothetical protein